MANPSIVIRIAADLEDLKKKLAEGGQAIFATTAGMDKLAASLDGEKLSMRAHNIVGAVNQIGGASKLTEAEKARLNRTLTAAIEKYEVMGKVAPQAMRDLAEQTRQVEQPTTAMSVAVGIMAERLATQAAGAITEFGKEAVMTAAKVESLRGVAQFLGSQAGFTGAEIDALAGALQRQGITTRQSYDTVIQMTRANLGLENATRLATVAQSLARATGENSSATLGKLIQGTQTLQVEVLRNAGVVIQLDQEYKNFAATNDRTVQSLSAQEKQQIALAAVIREGEKVAGVYGKTNEFVSGQMQSMARHHEEASRAIGEIFTPALKLGVAALTQFLQLVRKFPAEFAFVGTAIVGVVSAIAAFKGAAVLGVISATSLATAMSSIAPAVAVAAAAFTAWKAGQWIGETTGLTDAVERLAGRMMGLSKADVDAGMAARKFAESAEGKSAAVAHQAAQLAKLEEKARAATVAMAQKSDVLDEATAATERTATATKSLNDLFAESDALHAKKSNILKPLTGLMENFTKRIGDSGLALADAATKQGAFRSELVFTAETIETASVPALQKLEKATLGWHDAMMRVARGEGTMTGTVQAGGPFSATREQTQKSWDEGRYYGPVVNGSQQNPRGTGPDFKALGIEARAMGGPVEGGSTYMVGERGPELFVPRQSGTIVPNGGGGGVVVNVNVSGSVLTTGEDLSRLISASVVDSLRGMGARLPVAV